MEISIIAADANGALLTGKAASTALKIRRVSDGYLLDWDDLAFKASGWGHSSTALLEVDATNLPGEYRKVVVITAWTDGFYQALVHFDDATTVLNFLGEKYIQGGREVELNLDEAVSTRALEAGGNVAAIKADVEHATYGLNALLTAIGTRMATFTYTAPPAAADIATAVWANATRTLSSFGTLVADTAAAVWAAVARTLTDIDTEVIADAVWDEAIADHAGVGSVGEALSAAGLVSDPWMTPLPGSYAEGAAGKIIGDNLDEKISEIAVNPAQIFEGLLLTVNSPLTRVTLEGAATKLTLKQGEAKDVILSVVTSKRQPINLSGVDTFFLAIKRSKSDTTYIFSKDDVDFDKSLAASGIVSVFLTSTDTNQTPGTYVGELKMIYSESPAEIEKSADITIEIVKAVTD